jgi:RND superfamily putative drug exporter
MSVAAPGTSVPTLSGRPTRPRRDLLTALVWLVVVIGGAVSGAAVFNRVSTATDPAQSSESQRARRALEAVTGERDSILAVLIDTPPEAIGTLVGRLRQVPGVHRVRTSTDGQLPAPAGGGVALAVGIRADLTDQQANDAVDRIRKELGHLPTGRALVGGYPVLDRDLGLMAKADLARAELVALPIVLILLGVTLRSAVGSMLGQALVWTTVTGGLALLLGLSVVTEVSSFAVNVVTMFGIGLAVDYGLLVITRFRRERVHATSISDAVAATMATSGRTVALSGLTVAVALAGLLLFAEPVVRSIAYGGIGAVGVAVLSTLTLLPVLLRRFGHRIPPASPIAADPAARSGAFGTVARLVQRRPVVVIAASLGVLAVLMVPLGALSLQGVDIRALPSDTDTGRDARDLQQRLPPTAGAPITVLITAAPDDPRVAAFVSRLQGLDHVTSVVVRADVTAAFTVVDVAVDGPSGGRDAIAVVDRIRGIDAGVEVSVAGTTARFNDFIAGLTGRAPYAAVFIALVTFAVLLLATGGVLVAVKAVMMNLASLAASLGALVWIFQQGNLAGVLGFTATGGMSLIIIVLTAVFAFGLSTDYEVFLLSAVVAERHDGADSDAAVATGIQRTGRIITAAALLIVVVFVGFASGDVLIVKQLGLGLAIAVLLDATIVRLALTPALMTLLGAYNWAGPGWARRCSRRLWRSEAA